MDNGASSYRRFLSGDKTGLIDIISDHREGLVLYLSSFIGDFCTAEEIAEETFLKLYVDKPKFSEKCSFKTWLYTIGKHLAVDAAAEILENGFVRFDLQFYGRYVLFAAFAVYPAGSVCGVPCKHRTIRRHCFSVVLCSQKRSDQLPAAGAR